MLNGLAELLGYGKLGLGQYYEVADRIMDSTGVAVKYLARRYNRACPAHSEDWEDWWNEFYGEKLPIALQKYTTLSDDQAKGWIRTTAARFFLDKLRSHQSRHWIQQRNRENVVAVQSDRKPDCTQDMSSHLRNCIHSLKTGGKTIIRLKYYENLSHADIAAALKISKIASRQRLFRALDALKNCMMREKTDENV